MNLLKKLLYIVSWIPVILLLTFPLLMVWPFVDLAAWQAFLPVGLIFIGAVIVIPLALKFKLNMETLFLYGNREEGCPDWWKNSAAAGEEGKLAKKFPCWWWFAVRNPVNNLRFFFKDREPTYEGWPGDPMEAGDLLEKGVRKASRWAYSGPFAGYRRVWLNNNTEYSELWIGWKVGSPVPGLGFATQFRYKRKIGT